MLAFHTAKATRFLSRNNTKRLDPVTSGHGCRFPKPCLSGIGSRFAAAATCRAKSFRANKKRPRCERRAMTSQPCDPPGVLPHYSCATHFCDGQRPVAKEKIHCKIDGAAWQLLIRSSTDEAANPPLDHSRSAAITDVEYGEAQRCNGVGAELCPADVPHSFLWRKHGWVGRAAAPQVPRKPYRKCSWAVQNRCPHQSVTHFRKEFLDASDNAFHGTDDGT